MSVYSSKPPEPTEAVKTPIIPTSKVETLVSNDKSKIEPPASIYEKVNGKPYLAKKLNIDCWDYLTDDLDVDNIMESVKEIEDYILNEIKDSHLDDSLASFDDIWRSLNMQIGIKEQETVKSKLNKLKLYTNILKKQKKLDAQRREFYGKFTY